MARAAPLIAAGLYASALAGCITPGGTLMFPGSGDPPTTATIQEPFDVKFVPSDEPVRLGTEHFNRGNYGLAERYFQDAVEKAPKDVTAWIGLAAAYDRIGRFDLADRAYNQAIRLGGATTLILNNLGYSYLLRGDLGQAREKLMEAYHREPNNVTILNNLELLKKATQVRTSP